VSGMGLAWVWHSKFIFFCSEGRGSVPHIDIFLNFFLFLINKKRVRLGSFKSGASVCREAYNGICSARYGRLGEPSLPRGCKVSSELALHDLSALSGADGVKVSDATERTRPRFAALFFDRHF
jgi:hypothetical protein